MIIGVRINVPFFNRMFRWLTDNAGPGDSHRSVDEVTGSLQSAGYKRSAAQLRTIVYKNSDWSLTTEEDIILNFPAIEPVFWGDPGTYKGISYRSNCEPQRTLNWCRFTNNYYIIFVRDPSVAVQMKLIDWQDSVYK